MSPLSSSQTIIRFGDFLVDLHSGELRRHGIRIKLQVQPFRVLQILLKHPGDVVTREELQKSIWPADTFVDFDHGLNNAVKKLREALADDAEKPRFIETLSKRGYRFIGPVEELGNGARTPAGPAATLTPRPITLLQNRSGIRRAAFAVGAILGLSGLIVGLNLGRSRGGVFRPNARTASRGTPKESSPITPSYPVPLINYPLVPGTVSIGGPAFTLTVNGSGFVPGSVVNWNGYGRATTFVNSSQLKARIWPRTSPTPLLPP